MITPDGGTTKKHLILSLNVDTGDINPGWPVDIEATATYNGINFTPAIQQQRPALGIVGNILYVGYGSMTDCSPFHGWLIGVPIDNPASVTAWAAATNTHGGAIWGVGGVASDGKNPFVATGNTFSPAVIGTAGKQSFASSPARSLAARPAIIGRHSTGSILTVWTSIWAAADLCSWMCRVQRLLALVVALGKDTVGVFA